MAAKQQTSIAKNDLAQNGDIFCWNDGTKFGQKMDLCRDGPIDQCREMLAEKILTPSFWNDAEKFVAQPAPLGGYEIVRKALSRHLHHLVGGLIVPWDRLLLTSNVSLALASFMRCYIAPGDVVLCPNHFADFEHLEALRAENANIRFVSVNLSKQPFSQWNLSLKSSVELQNMTEYAAEKGKVRAILLHNPHPIFGWDGDGQRQLTQILEWATERGIFLLVDESLATLDLWGFSSCLGLVDSSRLVWVWSGAKHFSLPGLEFAAMLLPRGLDPPPLLQLHPCAPLVQYLVANLLEDLDWSSELFARRKSRLGVLRAKTIDGLVESGLSASETIAVSTRPMPWILVNLKKFLDDISFESERSLRDEFSQKAKLKLASGEQFGMTDPGWFRIRVEGDEDKLNEVLHRLRTVLAGKTGPALGWEKRELNGDKTETKEGAEEQGNEEQQEEDEIIQKVFSIFPKEQLGCKGPEMEEKFGTMDAKRTEWKEEETEEDGRGTPNQSKGHNQKKRQAAKMISNNTLGDLSFIEQMVRRTIRTDDATTHLMRGEDGDVSTEKEEGSRKAQTDEQYKSGKTISRMMDRLFEQREFFGMPINTGVVDSVGLDHSSPFFDHHSNDSNLGCQHYRQNQDCPLTRSDSGMVGEFSPEDAFCSSSDPTVVLTPVKFPHDDTVCSQDSAFRSDSSPEPNLTLAQLLLTNNRTYGPTAQMLNDSGIFLDFLPGSLSIDFPLLVPTEKLVVQNEENEAKLTDDENFAVELQFKRPIGFAEEKLRTIVASAGVEQQKNEVPKVEPFEVLRWRPMDQTEANSTQIEVEHELQMVKHDPRQHKLHSSLNEGTISCQTSVPTQGEVNWIEVDGNELEEIGGSIRKGMGRKQQPKQQPEETTTSQFYRNRSWKVTDVVEGWNERVRGKLGEEETRVELLFVDGDRKEREAGTEACFERDWTDHSQTMPIRRDEIGRSIDDNPSVILERGNDGNIPGRARYCQIHQRMKMGRKLEEEDDLRRNIVTVQHTNITQLEYQGGANVQTSISTRINRWAPDEWFKYMPLTEEAQSDDVERGGQAKEWEENVNRMDGECTPADELHSEFYTTVQYDDETGGRSTARTQHRRCTGKRMRSQQAKWPSRITVTTTLGRGESEGGRGDGLNSDRVTVLHTPGSRWIVSSVYRTTDWGWEKSSLEMDKR